ncbi:MAG: hypothetical protein NZ903_01730 [Candidatus Micrarchaeota archaeon]|nr:hypothetical protein [Candidatus Micrarchaeota archaeon]
MQKGYQFISKEIQGAALQLLIKNVQLKEGETILLITDRKSCPIFTSLSAAANQLGGKLIEAFISSDRQHSSPMPSIRDLCINSDVIIGVTDKSISHSPEVSEARKSGARVVSMPGITPELFVKGVSSDPAVIKRINLKLEKKLGSAKEIKVFSPSGTNAQIKIQDSNFDFSDNGDASQPGSLINVPYGEVYSFISTCSGKIVIDRWQNLIKQNENAIIELEEGKIIRWNNPASKYVMNQLNAGECGLFVCEFGIGTNPYIRNPIGITLNDEKIFGSAHFAFGGGGKRKCGIHEDFVVLAPTVLVDGEELIKRGRFLFNIGKY